MVLVTNSWRLWLIGMAASLAIFGLVYFTVIAPSENTANQAVKTTLQQSQQALNQASKQLRNPTGQAAASNSQASAADGQAGTVSAKVQQSVNKASKLAGCMAAAGTDTGKLQACTAKYGSS